MTPGVAGQRSRRRRGEEGGFTLIEILIALLVMMIGMAGVVMMQSA